ncbi:transposable element Tcb2 transposase [Trichonephila clavipes]|nr:transposable element Tcb2 transposase [Trichonephila clavipes]
MLAPPNCPDHKVESLTFRIGFGIETWCNSSTPLSNLKERHHFGGPGVIVWGGIVLNGRTELHIFDRGSVIGDRYCEEVLLPHVRLLRGVIGPDFIFMDGNARPHRTLAFEELLESEDITRIDWPAYSPDLNPIEHVWDALGRRITARLHHPENTQQLKQMLIEEWALLPQEMLHQLVLSMRRRLSEKKELSLQKDLDLLHNLPSKLRDVLTDEFSDEVPAKCQRIPTKHVEMHRVYQDFIPCMLNEDQSADEIRRASVAELKNMAKNRFQKWFDDFYK